MPTLITHAVVAGVAAKGFNEKRDRLRLWLIATFCSILPDADVIGFSVGVRYGDFFGHRGFFHSPFFSFLISLLLVQIYFSNFRPFSRKWWKHVIFFTIVGASHGLLDAFTDGGMGIALLSPLTDSRYFFPWTPIRVSPIGISEFFTPWGKQVIISEIIYVWVPLFALYAVYAFLRFVILSKKRWKDYA